MREEDEERGGALDPLLLSEEVDSEEEDKEETGEIDDCEAWPPPAQTTTTNMRNSSFLVSNEQPPFNSSSSGGKGNLATVVLTILFSFPAIIGSWCWPLLVAGMVGTVATQASKQMAHSISFGINLAVTTNVFQLVWHQNRNATKGGGNGNGGGSNKTTSKRPVFLVFCSIPLIMLDNVRHVLQDGEMIGKWSSMYRSDEKCYHHDFRCLSLVGWTCQIATTVGFALLLLGVLMSSGAWVKLKRRYRELRGTPTRNVGSSNA